MDEPSNWEDYCWDLYYGNCYCVTSVGLTPWLPLSPFPTASLSEYQMLCVYSHDIIELPANSWDKENSMGSHSFSIHLYITCYVLISAWKGLYFFPFLGMGMGMDYRRSASLENLGSFTWKQSSPHRDSFLRWPLGAMFHRNTKWEFQADHLLTFRFLLTSASAVPCHV